MQEKREKERCAMDDEVRVLRPNEMTLSAQTMDISESGLRLRIDEPLDVGTKVTLVLDFLKKDLPTATLEVAGEVMHRFREPGGVFYQVGMKLTYVSDQQEREVLTHLTTCRSTF